MIDTLIELATKTDRNLITWEIYQLPKPYETLGNLYITKLPYYGELVFGQLENGACVYGDIENPSILGGSGVTEYIGNVLHSIKGSINRNKKTEEDKLLTALKRL